VGFYFSASSFFSSPLLLQLVSQVTCIRLNRKLNLDTIQTTNRPLSVPSDPPLPPSLDSGYNHKHGCRPRLSKGNKVGVSDLRQRSLNSSPCTHPWVASPVRFPPSRGLYGWSAAAAHIQGSRGIGTGSAVVESSPSMAMEAK
jgi:hypothetical protein